MDLGKKIEYFFYFYFFLIFGNILDFWKHFRFLEKKNLNLIFVDLLNFWKKLGFLERFRICRKRGIFGFCLIFGKKHWTFEEKKLDFWKIFARRKKLIKKISELLKFRISVIWRRKIRFLKNVRCFENCWFLGKKSDFGKNSFSFKNIRFWNFLKLLEKFLFFLFLKKNGFWENYRIFANNFRFFGKI